MRARVAEAEENRNRMCWGAPGALVSMLYTGKEVSQPSLEKWNVPDGKGL